MFCIIGPGGVYKYVNKLFEQRFAFLEKNFIGTNSWDTVLGEDHEILRLTIEEAYRNPNKTYQVVMRKVANPKTGLSTYSLWELTPNLSDDGEIIDFDVIGREHNVNDLQVELLRHISDSFFIVNAKNEIEELHFNTDISEGSDFKTSIGGSLLELIPQSFRDQASSNIQSVLNGEESKVLYFERKVGSNVNYYRVELSSIAFQGLRHALWIEKDITNERTEQNEIAESLAKMRLIWDSMPSLFHSVNRDWEIEYANLAWEKAWGLTKEDYLNKNFWEVFPIVEGTRFDAFYRSVMATGEVFTNEEFFFPKTNNWYTVDLYPSANGIAIYTKDITEKKALEAKEVQLELKLKKVWESVIDGYLLLDTGLKITYANPAWRVMFEIEGEIDSDMAVCQIFTELRGHPFQIALLKARDSNSVIRDQFYFEFKDLWINAAIFPSENGLSVHMQDVSNQEKMRSAMSDLSFMTSHELRHEYAKLHSVINLLSVSNEDEKFLLKEAHKSLIQINSLISVMNDKLTFNRDNSNLRSENDWMEFEEAILIDDDHVINFINARVIRLMFPGSRVKSFINAEKALSYLKEFDTLGKKLVFIDLNMPGFDGWDFLEAYRHLPIKSPVYILTSSINPKDIERSNQYAEVVKFLTKPLSSDLLESERIRPVEFK